MAVTIRHSDNCSLTYCVLLPCAWAPDHYPQEAPQQTMLIVDTCYILSCLHHLPSKFTLACFEAPDTAYSIRGLGFYASWLSRCMLSCAQWVHTSPPRAQSSEAALHEATC